MTSCTGNTSFCSLYSPTVGHALPNQLPCQCGSETCNTNELCYVFPAEEVDYADFDPSSPDNLCYKVTCDDASGDWIWFGRSESDDPDNFKVWANVSVDQTNCQPVLSVTNSHGTEYTFYALLWWREIYAMYLFATPQERDAFESGTSGQQEPPSIFLLQDFGNAAPVDQCVYQGTFFEEMPYGTIGRDVNGTWSIGDVISRADIPTNRNCPPGYPRGIDATDIPCDDLSDIPSVSAAPSVVPSDSLASLTPSVVPSGAPSLVSSSSQQFNMRLPFSLLILISHLVQL